MRVLQVASSLFSMASLSQARTTFMMGYQEVRCFKENFFEDTTIDLFVELVEPGQITSSMIKDPLKDGITVDVQTPEPYYQYLYQDIIGAPDKSHLSYSYDIPANQFWLEGFYFICLKPTDSLFENALQASKENESSVFGSILSKQDYSKISFELSLTIERVHKTQIVQTETSGEKSEQE